jgi:hypothetical protein
MNPLCFVCRQPGRPCHPVRKSDDAAWLKDSDCLFYEVLF